MNATAIIHRLDRLDRWLLRLEIMVAVALFASLLAASAINILARNLFHHSFAVLLESEPALVLWIALTGASMALQQGRHIRLELLMRFLPHPWPGRARRITGLFGLVVMAALALASLAFVRSELSLFGLSGWPVAALPLFFILAAFRFGLISLGRPGPAPPGGPR